MRIESPSEANLHEDKIISIFRYLETWKQEKKWGVIPQTLSPSLDNRSPESRNHADPIFIFYPLYYAKFSECWVTLSCRFLCPKQTCTHIYKDYTKWAGVTGACHFINHSMSLIFVHTHASAIFICMRCYTFQIANQF